MIEILPCEWTMVDRAVALINWAYRGQDGWTNESKFLTGMRMQSDEFKEILARDDVFVFVAQDQGEVIGTIALERDHLGLCVTLLTVKPSLQGQGLGKQLLAFVECFAQSMGEKQLHMWVMSQRQELIGFYVRHGYLLQPETRRFLHSLGHHKQKGLSLALLVKIL